MQSVILATEDALSEAVGFKLLAVYAPSFQVSLTLGRKGQGYLANKIEAFCEMAQRQPVFLLTDLDKKSCAPLLIDQWMNRKARPKNLILRIVVTEIESWLLADHDAIKKYFGGRINKIPSYPDSLTDPKQALINLAKNAHRDVRRDIIIEKNAISSQGPGYNARLIHYVQNSWNPKHALHRSESLKRACMRLKEIENKLQPRN